MKVEVTPDGVGTTTPTARRVYHPGWGIFSILSLVGIVIFGVWSKSTDYGLRPFDYRSLGSPKWIGTGIGGGLIPWLVGFLTAGVTFKSARKSLELVHSVAGSVVPCLAISAILYVMFMGR
jgi:hypothetical protein